ncbi:hypothetical protein [Micropruina glycogenica]|nr:hypothetical protein [Micropruina glycogenica]
MPLRSSTGFVDGRNDSDGACAEGDDTGDAALPVCPLGRTAATDGAEPG